MKGKNKNSGGSFLGGIIVLIVGIGLLWYNEGRTVKTQAAINEASKNFVQVKSDKVDSKNEGNLIATNGKLDLTNSSELVDDVFAVKAKSVKLVRTVEMYQWEESCSTDDNNKETCTYKKEWNDDLVDSSSFKESGHSNPEAMPYKSENFLAENVKLGAFDMPQDLEERLSAKKEVGEAQLKEEYGDKVEGLVVSGKYITNVKEGVPEVGNIRVSFAYNTSNSASVLAQQSGNSFVQYTAKNGKGIYRIKDGVHTGKEIIADMTKENNTLKWILRLVGTLLIMLGIGAMFGPIEWLASFVPFLGGLVSTATSLISFVLGLSISLLVIAIAWFRFRPILSIVLIVIVIGLLVGLKYMRKPKITKKETE